MLESLLFEPLLQKKSQKVYILESLLFEPLLQKTNKKCTFKLPSIIKYSMIGSYVTSQNFFGFETIASSSVV